MPMTTKNSPIESLKLPTDYSREEFERACEFVKQVKEIDEEQNHRGIFIQYITAMKLYRSGSLDMVEVKNRITTIFKNCDVLLDGFHRIMKDLDCQDHIVVLKRMVGFLKALAKESERLRLGLMEAFVRFKEHKDGQNGIVQNEKRDEITFDREDEMFEKDMYFHSIESAIKFAAAEEDKKMKKPPAGVYGAMRRLYAQRR
ncbi:Paired amphipathic helix superfamily, partial [Arabidopsis suecica]